VLRDLLGPARSLASEVFSCCNVTELHDDAWTEESEASRTAKLEQLVAFVDDKLRSNHWYPGAMQQKPRVQVFAASREGAVLRVHFVADHLMYCHAQSGSDWAEHFVFVGDAEFHGGERRACRATLVETVGLSERDVDDYDSAAVIERVRAAAIAKLA
jgi:hypothetical protein